MLVKIAKEFRWEMGHRLSYHQEGCQNLHGHSYRMSVELVGELNQNGMVLDYGKIKEIVEPILLELDHSTMLSEDDTQTRDFFESSGMKAAIVPFHPTAENMCIWFLDLLKPKFQQFSNIKTLTVRVCETLTATAEATTEL